MDAPPQISAVICTRNRGSSVVQAVESILSNQHSSFELILIDQSTDQETRQAITPFLTDPRFQYIWTQTIGLGHARNIGLLLARAELVAYTDDDCSVPTNWLTALVASFALHPRVMVVFSNVTPCPHDPMAGFIPAYSSRQSKLICNFWDKCLSRGIGASMAVRRKGVLALGGFDEMLGAGGYFPSCEDTDIAIRALTQGQWVYHTAEVSVIHYGFRTWHEGRALARRDWVGIGACYVKPLRAGHWEVLLLVLHDLLVLCLLHPLKPVLRLRRPRGFGRFVAFASGFLRGLHYPMNNQQMTYQPVLAPVSLIGRVKSDDHAASRDTISNDHCLHS